MKIDNLPNNLADHARLQAKQIAYYLKTSGFTRTAITLIFLEAIEDALRDYSIDERKPQSGN